MKRALAGCLALLIFSAGVAYAVSGTEKQAEKIFNRVLNETLQRPVCQATPQPATLTHDAPSQALLSTLAILRRPATPADTVPQQVLTVPLVSEVFVDYVRLARTADGRSYDIVPALNTNAIPPVPDACLSKIHENLLHVLKGKSHRIRKRVLALFKGFSDFNHRQVNQPPEEVVFVFQHAAHGIPGNAFLPGTAQDIQQGGAHIGVFDTRGGSVVESLVPDPVSSVTMYFPRLGRRPASNRTEAVEDNMISFTIPRDSNHADPVKMVWRAVDGSIVRVIRHPG